MRDNLYAFLGDLWEQVDLYRQSSDQDQVATDILDELQARLSGLGLIVAVSLDVQD